MARNLGGAACGWARWATADHRPVDHRTLQTHADHAGRANVGDVLVLINPLGLARSAAAEMRMLARGGDVLACYR
jgi:hypothetical protein